MSQLNLKNIFCDIITFSLRLNYCSINQGLNKMLNGRLGKFISPKEISTTAYKQFEQSSKVIFGKYVQHEANNVEVCLGKKKFISFVPVAFGFSLFGFKINEDKEEKDNEIVHMMKLAILAAQNGDPNKAEQLLHIALKSAQEVGDEQAITYIYDLMANFALEELDFKKAEKLFVIVLQRFLQSGIAENDNALVEVSLKLSNIYINLGEVEKASQGFQFCIVTQEKKLKEEGEENVDEDTLVLWAMSQDWYARFLLNLGVYDKAKEHFLRAYDVCVKVKGPDDPQTAVLLNDIGSVCSLQKSYDEALDFFNKAIEIGSKCQSDDLPTFYINLGTVYIQKELFKEAESSCQKGLVLSQKDENKETINEALACLKNVKQNFK